MKKLILGIALMLTIHLQAQQNKAYITKVLEFVPAPGQFVNLSPAYAERDNSQTMCTKCLDDLNDEGLVSLGAYGGYITVGFDHTIAHSKGEYDFKVLGNTFGGSAEPGIIMVSADTNKDGLPNDEWFEIKGSEYDNPATIHDYEITYYKPATSTDKVRWTDNKNAEGYIERTIHFQPYFPQWVNEPTITFKGSKLPNNGAFSTEQDKWIMASYAYGYADNLPNDSEGVKIKLDWVVDSNGNAVNIKGIDFIRIYTAVNQAIGRGVGEISTEVSGVEDLHPTLSGESTVATIHTTNTPRSIYYNNGEITVQQDIPSLVRIYNMQGEVVKSWQHEGGLQNTSVKLNQGLYIIQIATERLKIVVR